MADEVRLTIEEDTAAPPGHARLCFAGLAPPADARFRLRRLDAEPEHLGLHGWQNSPALLEPDAVVEEGGATVLKVGPAVVDRMAADAPIELAVPAAGLSLRSYWPDIAPSPGAADLSVALPGRPAIEPAAPLRPAATPPVPPQEPAAQIAVEPPAPPAPSPPAAATVEPEPEPVWVEPPEPVPPPEPIPPPPPEPDPGSRRWLPLALGLLALLVVGGAWQLGLLPWPADEDQPTEQEQQEQAERERQEREQAERERQQQEQAERERQQQEQAERERQEQERERQEQERDWRAELLAAANNHAPAEELFELGEGAAAAGELETALLAYEEAIRQGHGPALLAIGRWYDPAHFTPESSPFSEPNPEQAAAYYKRAGEAGAAAAADALKELCAGNAGAAWTEQGCPPTSGD